jgi:hypothetical protein
VLSIIRLAPHVDELCCCCCCCCCCAPLLLPLPHLLLLQLLASQVLNPRSIDVSLDDIGGLTQVKEDMVRGTAAQAQHICVLYSSCQ